MTDSFMDRFADQMTANGFRILPIGPGTKSPQRCHFDEWQNLPEWERFCDREAKTFELLQWKRWPGAGIGIACGNVCGIDIDVMDGPMSMKLRALAVQMLGDTPLLRIGQAPKALLVYRTDKPFPGIKRHPIEALCHGQQFVACAVHPKTHRPYDWPEDHPATVDVSSLPMVTLADVQAFMEAAWNVLPEDMRQKSLAHGAHSSGWAGPTDQRGTVAAITSAMQLIPNDDVNWDDWFRIGMALKGALGDEGVALFDEWSARSIKHVSSETANMWRTIKPHTLGAGTIYWLAEQHGWSPDASLTLNAKAEALKCAPHPAAGLIHKLSQRPALSVVPASAAPATGRPQARARPAYKIAPHLLPTTGILGAFVRYAVGTAESPQPFLALGAGLAMLGAVAGRRYASPTGLRTNIYGIGVADSGGGKDNARKCAKALLFAAGLDKWVGGEELPSAPGLLTSLTLHPAKLFQIDEFGKFLADLVNPRAAKHQAAVLTMLTKLFTGAGEVIIGAEYADQSANGRPRADIHMPNACIWGTTVPGPLWAAVEGGALSDGSLARFLVFLSECHYPDDNEEPDPRTPPSDLVERIQAVARGADNHSAGGNLAELFTSNTPMDAYPVPFTAEANAALRSFKRAVKAELRSHEGEYTTAIFARQAEHTIKVAMLSAISTDPACPVITLADFEWARDLVQHCIDTMLVEAEAKSADTPAEARVKKVLAIIASHGGPMDGEAFSRKMQWIEKPQRDAAINLLIEGNQIRRWAAHEAGKQRPVTFYGLVTDAPPELSDVDAA